MSRDLGVRSRDRIRTFSMRYSVVLIALLTLAGCHRGAIDMKNMLVIAIQ